MREAADLAAEQLRRMRGMTRYYHRRFFVDIQFTVVVVLALFAVAMFGAEDLYLAVPVVALLGAAQTAFDASYLIFSRHYAARLERFLNDQAGARVLVAADLENTYLFPLDRRKIVTLAAGKGFSWFGFMTALYTLVGVSAYLVGIVAAAQQLEGGYLAIYLTALLGVTATTLIVGLWWFVGGEGERRLRAVLDGAF